MLLYNALNIKCYRNIYNMNLIERNKKKIVNRATNKYALQAEEERRKWDAESMKL